jgi:hypothetical protein
MPDFVEAVLSDTRLARVAADLERMKLGSIRIHASLVEEEALELGQSKFGGRPDVPRGMAWPTAKLDAPPPSDGFREAHPELDFVPADGIVHLPLVAQFRLSELAPYDSAGLLPPEGMLYFFHAGGYYDSDTGAPPGPPMNTRTGYRWDAYRVEGPERSRVLYHPEELGPLVRTDSPPDVPKSERYGACRLALCREETLPSLESSYIGERPHEEEWEPETDEARERLANWKFAALGLKVTEEEWLAYADLHYPLRTCPCIHQMLGHPDGIHGYPKESAYMDVRDRFFPGRPPFGSLSASAQLEELSHGRLLLQVNHEANGMWFGRNGRLFFFIRDQDLAASDFSHVWTEEH